ncbi:MAG: DUF620 domain-containing protein [Bryobacteraceae bacterium]
MTRRLAIVVMLASVSAFGAELPSAESLLDRFVQVSGGKQAFASRKSEIARGTVEMAAMGVKGSLVRYSAAPGQSLLEMEIAGIGKFLTGSKDDVAWDQSDLMGPRIKAGLERAEALRESKFNATAAWRELYPKVVTTGEESVSGEDCYKVSMTPTEGPAETMYLSKKTGLAMKMAATASTQMGDVDAEILFLDYKEFGGILTPTKSVERTAGQEMVITIESIEINPDIPASKFDPPAGVAALLAKLAR